MGYSQKSNLFMKVLSGGIVVADGDTKTILGDSKLLSENRLELPVGFSL